MNQSGEQKGKSGYIVKTKSGKNGQTKHDDNTVNGKVPVYEFDGSKILCSLKSLKVVGYYD